MELSHFVIGELIRYLTKSPKREYYIQDAQMLYHAFQNRGYTQNADTRARSSRLVEKRHTKC